MSKSLQLVSQNGYLQASYFDVVNNNVTIDTRTGDEIAFDVITKAGLNFGE